MNIIIKDISKRYGRTVVFKNFNLEIKEQQTTVIMGASGVGKTTLLNVLLRLEKPDSGKVEGLAGKKVVAVFQENRLVEHLDSMRNIEVVCKKDFSRKELLEEFKQVGLEDVANKSVSELSGGMKRRVAIVRSVFVDSDIIVMDEPFKGLDLELKSKVIKYIRNKTRGKTVIIVTHNLDEVSELEAEKVKLNFTE